MNTKTVIVWGVGMGRCCPHKTITFTQDDRVEMSRIETTEAPVGDSMTRTPVSRVQILRPAVEVICEDCGQRGTMMLEENSDEEIVVKGY